MSKWISGKYLITRWNIEDFELVGYAKQGLQPYDTVNGRRVIDTDSLPCGPKYSREQIELQVRTKEHLKKTGPVFPLRYRGPREELLSEDQIKRVIQKVYKAQPLDTPIPPEDDNCILISFTIPRDRKKARDHIAHFLNCLFKMDDVLEFEKKREEQEQEFGKAFPKAVEHGKLTGDIEKIENMEPRTITEIGKKRKELAELHKELKLLSDYFNGSEENTFPKQSPQSTPEQREAFIRKRRDMSQLHKHFPDFDPEVLEDCAHKWAGQYPIIKSVVLYKGGCGSHKYALVVTLHEAADPRSDQQQTRDLVSFRKWTFGGEACSHILEDLESAYYEKTGIQRDTWMWISQHPGEPQSDLIVPKTAWVLYDSAAQAHDEDKGTIPEAFLEGFDTEQGLNKIAEKAIRYREILVDHLVYILAAEEKYTALLPELWEKYHCTNRRSKPPERFEAAWQTLLYRWALGMVEGAREQKPIDPYSSRREYLPLYYFNEETEEHEKYDSLRTDHSKPLVKLDDLKKYFTETIEIPLPTRLFPDRESKDSAPHKRPSIEYFPQLDLRELRIIAQTWKSRFPVIKKLLLYRSVDVNKGKYVVDVRVNDQDPIEYRRFERDWVDDGKCYLDVLPGLYKNRENYSDNDWRFLMPKAGNDPNDFPNLRSNILELQSKRWVKQYPDVPIERIILYHYSSRYQKALQGRIPVKYAVVFEVSKIEGAAMENAYQELIADTEYYQTVAPAGGRFLALISADFRDHVYKHPPEGDFECDWTFIPPDTQLPEGIITDEPYWVLFDEPSEDFVIKESRFDLAGYVEPLPTRLFPDHEHKVDVPESKSTEKPTRKKVRQSTQDKIQIQGIARKLWNDHPDEIRSIKEMANQPEIRKIVGKLYKPRTVHGWISGVAPKYAQKPGIRSKVPPH